MALIVSVSINDREIIKTWAVRVAGNPGELCTYESDLADMFEHHYDKGAEALAIKLLQNRMKFNKAKNAKRKRN